MHKKDEALKASINALKLEVLELKEDNSHKAEVKALKLEVQELKIELVLCKSSVTNNAMAVQVAHKLDVPKPKELKGNQSAKEVDNFLWSMEKYFGAMGIQDKLAKVQTL